MSNNQQIDGSKLSNEQLAAASRFLTLMGWKESDPTSKVRREDIARLIAWYGAIRYQAGTNGIGTLEIPGQTVLHRKQSAADEDLIEFEIVDVNFRSMDST